MKKAINIWSFGEKAVKDAIDLAKIAGFDGIELALDKTGPVSLVSSQQDLLEIKSYAEKTGVKIHSLATGLYWQYSMTSDDKNEREKAIDIAKSQLRIASVLGADGVLIVPGAVGVDFTGNSDGIVRYDIAYDRALDAINEIKSVAEECQVYACIENVWNKFLLSPIEMRDFIDKIDSRFVGAFFDVGNVVFCGYPEHWIEILGKRIKKVHFKDYRRAAGGIHGFVDLLAGDVNWPAVAAALRGIGYDNWVTAEMVPAYIHCTDQIIYNTSGAMDSILSL